MKNYLISLLLTLFPAALINADVIVHNATPFPIKFSMTWTPKAPYNGLTNPWTDQTSWEEAIARFSSRGKSGDTQVNIKTGYKIEADRGKGWETVIDAKGLKEPGHRQLFITFDPDAYETKRRWMWKSEGSVLSPVDQNFLKNKSLADVELARIWNKFGQTKDTRLYTN